MTMSVASERGRLYEIPLLFMFYFVLCAIGAPYLSPRRGGTALAVLCVLMLLGLGASALLGAAVSPRFRILGLPAVVATYVLLSLLTAPLLLAPGWGALAPVILPVQVYVAYRVELLLAGVQERRERESGSG